MKFTKRIKERLDKKIGGWKGAVSILLVIVMSPIFTIALTLMEADRFQSASEMMSEVVDASAYSSIADFDEYIDQRFDILCTSQEVDVTTSYSNYLKSNVNAMGKSVTVNSSTATVVYPIADTTVLMNQIKESSTINASVAGLKSAAKQLTELLNKIVTDGNKQLKEISDTADSAKKIASFLQYATSFMEKYKDAKDFLDESETGYNACLKAYKHSYDEFEAACDDLSSEIESNSDNLAENQTIWDIDSVVAAGETAEDAANDYKDSASDLRTAIGTLNTKISEAETMCKKMADSAEELKSDDMKEGVQAFIDMADRAVTFFNETIGHNYSDHATQDKSKLQTQVTDLGNFKMTDVTADWSMPEKYKPISITIWSDAIANEFNNLWLLISDTTLDETEEEHSSLVDFIDIVYELLGISFLYDESCNSNVDTSLLYNDTAGLLSGSTSAILNGIQDLMSACDDFSDLGTSFSLKKLASGLVSVFKGLGELLSSIALWVTDLVTNLTDFFANGLGDQFVLYNYCAYNLPNRTTFVKEKTFSKYSFRKIFDMAGGTLTASVKGKLAELPSDFTSGLTGGSDKMFKGCEGEYCAIGTNSEVVNQMATAFNIYLLRFMFDFADVNTNSQVNAMSEIPYLGAIIRVLIYIAEPFMDTLILTNGGKVWFLKDFVYLTPSGIPVLLKDLASASDLSESLKNKIKAYFKTATDAVDKGEFEYKTSYTDYIVYLLISHGNSEQVLQRLQNVIQMECNVYYEEKGITSGFTLDKSGTAIQINTNYKLNALFNNVGLTSTNGFNYTKTQYVGY